MRSRLLVLSLSALLCGCFDFGYDIPALNPPAGGGGGGGDGGPTGDCVEGEVPATTEGVQVRFVALDVDVRQVQVTAGGTVTWTNTDSMAHSVNAGAPGAEVPESEGGFNSPSIPPGGQWAYRFCSPRPAFYFCAIHPGQMTGYRVVVQ